MRWWLACVVATVGCTFGGGGLGTSVDGGRPSTADDGGDGAPQTGPGNGSADSGGSGTGGIPNPAVDSSGSTTSTDGGETSPGDTMFPVDGTSTSGTDDTAGTTAAEPLGPLVEDGLLVRYYLDEESESSPDGAFVLDSAPAPNLDLVLSIVESEPKYVELPSGNRGLEWDAASGFGLASAVVSGEVMTALDGQSDATIEFVADVNEVEVLGSRFVHIGPPESSDSHLAVVSNGPQELELRWEHANPLVRWDVDLQSGRAVYTVVLDLDAPSPVRLFVDGVEAPTIFGPVLSQAQVIVLDATDELTLGNRPMGERSFGGGLFYAAVYDRALTEAEVQANAALLAVKDDAP